MSETAFQAQRRKLRDLKEKQDAGEEPPVHPDSRITPKAQARRDADAATAKSSKKKAKKKIASG